MRNHWLHKAMNQNPEPEIPIKPSAPPTPIEEPVFIEQSYEPDICGYTIVPGVFCDLPYKHEGNHSNEGNEHREERLAIATEKSKEAEKLVREKFAVGTTIYEQCPEMLETGRCTLIAGHEIEHKRFFPNLFEAPRS